MSKKCSLILILAVSLVLVIAALLLGGSPDGGGPWSGDHIFITTTPTGTLRPETGWWDRLPTPAGTFISDPSSIP